MRHETWCTTILRSELKLLPKPAEVLNGVSQMVIERPAYLSKLVSLMWNGQAKVITGIRRCGKSYLLKKIFREYLVNAKGVPSENILVVELDDIVNAHLRNPLELSRHVRNWAAEKRGEKYRHCSKVSGNEVLI